jgi:hypothetical protein
LLMRFSSILWKGARDRNPSLPRSGVLP